MTKVTQTYGKDHSFYFVLAEGGSAPSYRHNSRIKAVREAQRLAKMLPGTKFHVVKLKDTFMAGESSDPLRALQQKFSVGSKVSIRAGHHTHAGRTGFITEIPSDPNDTSIYVALVGDNLLTPTRFSPSSLQQDTGDHAADAAGYIKTDSKQTREGTRDEAQEDVRSQRGGEAQSIGSILARAALPFAISAILGRIGEEGDGGTTFMDDMETKALNKATKRIDKLAKGDNVIVVSVPSFLGIIPGEGIEGKFAGRTDDPAVVEIDFLEQEGQGEQRRMRVGISRVFAAGDSEVMKILGLVPA